MAPRAYHRKSKMGCRRCRARRVKVRINSSTSMIVPAMREAGSFRYPALFRRTCCIWSRSYLSELGQSSRCSTSSCLQSLRSIISLMHSFRIDSTTDIRQCDEVRPVCNNCHRQSVSCVYDRDPVEEASSTSRRGSRRESEAESSGNQASRAGTESPFDLPESRARRILELRILHHFTTETSWTLESGLVSPSSKGGIWTDMIYTYVFKNDALLYSILHLSAQHLSRSSPPNPVSASAHSTYLDLAIPLHRRELAHLDQSNADCACLTSSMLRVSACVTLQDRPLTTNPYTPPTQWLLMTRGALKVFREAWTYIADDPQSLARHIVLRNTPYIPSYWSGQRPADSFYASGGGGGNGDSDSDNNSREESQSR